MLLVTNKSKASVIRLLQLADSLNIDRGEVRNTHDGMVVPENLYRAYQGSVAASPLVTEPGNICGTGAVSLPDNDTTVVSFPYLYDANVLDSVEPGYAGVFDYPVQFDAAAPVIHSVDADGVDRSAWLSDISMWDTIVITDPATGTAWTYQVGADPSDEFPDAFAYVGHFEGFGPPPPRPAHGAPILITLKQTAPWLPPTSGAGFPTADLGDYLTTGGANSLRWYRPTFAAGPFLYNAFAAFPAGKSEPVALELDTPRFIPVRYPREAVVRRAGVRVTTPAAAGGIVRVGIWGASQPMPSSFSFVHEFIIATDVAGFAESTLDDIELPDDPWTDQIPGWMWIGIVAQGSPCSLSSVRGGNSDLPVWPGDFGFPLGDTASVVSSPVSGSMAGDLMFPAVYSDFMPVVHILG